MPSGMCHRRRHNDLCTGFEGTKAKLVDLSVVENDGSLAPLPVPPPAPPPPPMASGWSFGYDPSLDGNAGSSDDSSSSKLFGFWPSSLGAFIVVFVLLPLALLLAGAPPCQPFHIQVCYCVGACMEPL